MKVKKLFIGLFCLSALMLGACGNKNDSKSNSQSGADSETTHTHTMVFNSFVWTETPGAYTAKAKYVCSANDGNEEMHDAEMSKTTDAPTHVSAGANHWKASYDGHEDTRDEVIPCPGHSYNAVGLCLADGAFDGVTATVGSNTTPDNYVAGHKYFFRILAERGHTYSLQNAGVTPNETVSYYLDSTGEPVEYDKAATPFPMSGTFDSYIYFVHQPTLAENNASFRANLKSHEARADEFGFCLDHPEVYAGYDMDVNDPIDLEPNMPQGKRAFRRVQVNQFHKYSLYLPVDSSLVVEDFNFALKHSETGYSVFDITETPAMISQLSSLSSDNYVYITIEPNGLREDPSFAINSAHNYNPVGLCIADYNYIEGDNHNLTLGAYCDTLNYVSGTTYYYRMRAYAGHTYNFVPNSWPSARTDVYYVQTDGVPSSLGNMGSSFVIEFPEEGSLDGYIYLVFAPTSNGSGSFKIDLTDHPVENEHGSCPHESESYTVAPVLVNGVPYGTNFTIEAHKYAFFKAELSSIVLDEYDMFRLWYGHDHYQWVSLWFKSNGTWVEFQATDGGNVDYGEYDVTDADQTSWTDPDIPVVPDDGYIYIQMHNDSNNPLNVVGNDLGINIF